MHRIRSGSNLAAVIVESRDGNIKQKEEQLSKQIGPHDGFDLKQIGVHYQHRRRLRREKMVLRYGEMVPLVARHSKDWHSHVLAFARFSLIETAVITINLNDFEVWYYVDLQPLIPLFMKAYDANTVIMVSDWMDENNSSDYYFLREFLSIKHMKKLLPFESCISGITVCQDDPEVFKKALTRSLERTKAKLSKGESIDSEQISLLFTDIVQKEPIDIEKFANVVGSIQEVFLGKMNMSFNDLFLHNDTMKNDSDVASKLMGICRKLIATKATVAPVTAANTIVDTNKLGPIVICTPEVGRWSTVGGLGVMVDELAYGLALLGQDVTIISPYYERNRKGERDYLARDPAGINWKSNIEFGLGGGYYTLGVHAGVVNNVKVVFLHNADVFPSPYPDFTQASDAVRTLAVFGKACLQYCCNEGLIPSICLTNDWFTGLIPGYAKAKHYGDTFNGTTFFHIVHNLEPTYEGRIYPRPDEGGLETFHGLPYEWLINPYWERPTINPSRCAIMLSDQWGTVSKSYKEDLFRDSPLQDILRMKVDAFSHPNGIPIEARIKKLDAAAPDHLSAKKVLQTRYFGYGELDDSVPLFGFVGRITSQKGVHLILDAAEELIHRFDHKINILVGGPASMNDPYAAGCAHKMWYLRNKYPHCFWADPQGFFIDGSVLNRGADFGLMPSVFEPGGIVQHEFFVGETPVIAFKTGGLKDSVFEFLWDSEEGTGFTFESHSTRDMVFAMERAIGTFKNKEKYQKLRKNAFRGTMSGEIVCKAWLKEFNRLRGKILIDETVVDKTVKSIPDWQPSMYKPMSNFEQLFGVQKKSDFALDDLDLGAEEVKEVFEEPAPLEPVKKKVSDLVPHVFMFDNHGPRFQKVQLVGSFDDWETRMDMNFDEYTNQWFITKHLKRGKYT